MHGLCSGLPPDRCTDDAETEVNLVLKRQAVKHTPTKVLTSRQPGHLAVRYASFPPPTPYLLFFACLFFLPGFFSSVKVMADQFQQQSQAFLSWFNSRRTKINPKIHLADLRHRNAGRGVGTCTVLCYRSLLVLSAITILSALYSNPDSLKSELTFLQLPCKTSMRKRNSFL